jgi:hypothetical protein
MMECWEERWRTVISHWSIVVEWLHDCMDAWGDGVMEYWEK